MNPFKFVLNQMLYPQSLYKEGDVRHTIKEFFKRILAILIVLACYIVIATTYVALVCGLKW